MDIDRTTGGEGPWNQKFQTLLTADDVPDVAWQDLEHLTRYGGLGVLADLTPYMTADKLDTNGFFEAAIKGGQRQGKQVGLPRSLGVAPVYFNRRHLQESGLKLTEANWTWDDLLSMARRLAREAQGVQRWGFGMYNEFGLTLVSRIWQNGGEVVSADEKTCLLDQKPAMDALQWWYDLVNKWRVSPTRAELDSLKDAVPEGAAAVFLLAAQRASMGTEGTWSPATLNKAADLDWDLQTWPSPRGGKRVSSMTQGSVAVLKGARAPDAGWALVKFLTGKEAQQLQAANAQWCPPRKSVINDPVAQQGLGKGKNVKAIFAELDVARQSPIALARWTDVNRYLNPALARLYNGEPATTVLPEVTRQINDALKQPPA